MTVRAAYLAFLDLCRHHRPRLTNYKQCDVLTFGRAVTVIELQSDDVALTTVNARMRTQVRAEKTPVLRSAAASSVNLACDVLGPISQVMRPAVRRMTRAAVGLSCAERLTSKSERRDGLEEVAPDAEAKRFVGLWVVYERDRQGRTSEGRGRPFAPPNEPLERLFYHLSTEQSSPARE